MFGMFLLFYIVNLNTDLDFLKYFTPFKYFDAGTLMERDFHLGLSIAMLKRYAACPRVSIV